MSDDTKGSFSVVRLADDPEHIRLVTKVDGLGNQVQNLLTSYHTIENSNNRIERALFGGWTDQGQRSDGFISTMNSKLTAVDEKAAQAIELAQSTQQTFGNIKNGVWAIFIAVLTSLIPAAMNIYSSLHSIHH